jgi:hypothetical protein
MTTTMRYLLTVVIVLLLGVRFGYADPPVASYIFPAGGQRGKTVDFRVGGLFLHKQCSFEMLGPGVTASKQLLRTKTVWFEGPLLPLPESQQPEDYPKDFSGKVQIASDAPLGIRHWRVWNAQGVSPPKRFVIGDLPEIVENEIEGDPIPVEVQFPLTINGRIFPRENVDIWTFKAQKGQTFSCEVMASRLGSPLDSRLEIRDSKGRRIAENDDTFGADSFVRFTAAEDGSYQVRVHDISFRGGPEYVYRLTLKADSAGGSVPEKPRAQSQPTRPDFRLRLPTDVLTNVLGINRGSQAKFKVMAERQGGFAGPITLAMRGLPAGVTATPPLIPAGQAEAEITFKAESSAALRGSRLTIEGSAKIGDRLVTHIAQFPNAAGDGPQIDSILVAVTLPTPFKIVGDFDMRWAPRGTTFRRHYRLERGGFQGPIEISLADRQARHLQGITGPTITVPPGVNEFDYAIQFPPWMETGRTARACIMAVGTVKDRDGSEHAVSFSSAEPNEQLIVVIEPGRLSVETERNSLLVEAGKTVALPVRVTRGKSLRGPAKLELILPSHIRSISADSALIAADETTTKLLIHFASSLRGPFNTPLVIRATILDKGEPVVAETKVAVQPAQ